MFRSPTFKLVLAALVLVVLSFSGYAVLHKEVTVVDGDSRIKVSTFASSVGKLLEQKEIRLGSSDAVEPGLDTALKEGCTVKIFRAFTVTITADGKEKTLETPEKKVEEILQAVGIPVGDQDIVHPELNTVINGETEIKVQRVAWKEVVEEKSIPYQEITKRDSTLNKGVTKLITKGIQGTEKSRYKVTYVDGKKTKRELLETVVSKKPQSQVVAVGTVQLASRGGRSFTFDRQMSVVATAYTHTGRNTYTGRKPGVGTISVDPRVIPLGTRLYVEGYGYGVAQDVGRAIVGNRIDVFLESEAAARKWGRKTVKVYVLK